jgi:NADH:ubiquinone oxidoreductase subunit D
VRDNNRKYVPPPRSEIGVSMEALIHHFKLWTEGFNPPAGSVYTTIESPRGEMVFFLNQTAEQSLTVCIIAHRLTPCCKFYPFLPRVVWWQT